MSAPYVSALTIGATGSVYLAINEALFINGAFSFLLAGLLGFILYGLIGLLFASILLIPLQPLFNKSSLPISLAIFLIVGILIPLIIQHGLNQINAHDIDPYSPEEKWGTIARMTIVCFIGAAGALSAWFTLKRELQANDN